MRAKRPSLKGKGAEIFLGSGLGARRVTAGTPERQNTIIPEYQNAGAKEKATFYLPIEVLEDLETLWREMRGLTKRKIKKSDIVKVALNGVSQEFKKWRAKELKTCQLIDQLSRR